MIWAVTYSNHLWHLLLAYRDGQRYCRSEFRGWGRRGFPGYWEEQILIYRFCLVGCFLTASVVHFSAMRNTLANIWHPLEEVQISDLGDKRYLFKFFNELDISPFISGALWTFSNHLLIFYRIKENEDPMSVPLIFSDWWVQVHDLPPGFLKDSMAMQFGNFLGRFMEYYINGYTNYMHIRVQIDVRKPLKRSKKIMISTSKFTYAHFKYEKLTLFCFLCGCLGHGDNFCPMRLQNGLQEVTLGWDLPLRAIGRRATTVNSIWLREEDGSKSFGKSNFGIPKFKAKVRGEIHGQLGIIFWELIWRVRILVMY
ncbi:hypothetical protein PVK06_032486 [Gossypium arboreum]|uniref:Zinc knuckle CX2CX4HX4C domain-containing protein n=1 Tax=Gossypium arboreum TaxID=29729 RepID=A0ABR0NU03_GOSAR|nr:hypothetical protein PVK06_032486 [Gossypium arboreum]